MMAQCNAKFQGHRRKHKRLRTTISISDADDSQQVNKTYDTGQGLRMQELESEGAAM